MFFRMVKGALFRQKGKMIMIALTIALGAALSTAMINVLLDVGDKINQELKTYGANIRVVSKYSHMLGDLFGFEEQDNQYLNEKELPKIKSIFWTYNIVDFAPYLYGRIDSSIGQVDIVGTWFNKSLTLPIGEEITTGISKMKNWWEVKGKWINDQDTYHVMIGKGLADHKKLSLGSKLIVSGSNQTYQLEVSGIFESGDDDDHKIYMPLNVAQQFLNKEGLVSSIDVSALTTPDNELAKRAARNPEKLSVDEMETWYCTAYVSSISYQIQEVISNSIAKPVRQVAESEGTILEKTQLLMTLITVICLIGSALGISNLITACVMERSKEIGLIKSLGATNFQIIFIFLTEIIITGFLGLVFGYFVGFGLAQLIGVSVFGSFVAINTTVIPIVSFLMLIVILMGSIPSIRMLLRLEPTKILHGR